MVGATFMIALELLQHPSMRRIAAVLRVAMSHEWQAEYPETTFWAAWQRLTDKHYRQGGQVHPTLQDNAVSDICVVLAGIVQADSRLSLYTEDDLRWLTSEIAGERGSLMLTMLVMLAYTTPSNEWMTPVEVAEATDTADSGWRNKAAAGGIPGAILKGKQWLLPRSILEAMGVLA